MVATPTLASDISADGDVPPPFSELTSQNKAYGGTRPLEQDAYGTAHFTQQAISPGAFTPLSNSEWSMTGSQHYRSGGTNSATCADVTLPSGALLPGLTYYLYDNDAVGYMDIRFFRHDFDPGTMDQLFGFATVAGETPGWVMQYRSLPDGVHTVDNDRAAYRVCVYQWSQTGSNLGTRGTTFWFLRQVSPAPAVATFNDVPTGHLFFQFVEALADSGITAGCGGGNFCPNAPITRGEMAVFLSAALGLHYPD
jgi:hypothetical protein